MKFHLNCPKIRFGVWHRRHRRFRQLTNPSTRSDWERNHHKDTEWRRDDVWRFGHRAHVRDNVSKNPEKNTETSHPIHDDSWCSKFEQFFSKRKIVYTVCLNSVNYFSVTGFLKNNYCMFRFNISTQVNKVQDGESLFFRFPSKVHSLIRVHLIWNTAQSTLVYKSPSNFDVFYKVQILTQLFKYKLKRFHFSVIKHLILNVSRKN